jgi:hypothetical protein
VLLVVLVLHLQRAWLTAVANDKYLTPTLALSHTLDQFSCVKTKIALVPDDLQVIQIKMNYYYYYFK